MSTPVDWRNSTNRLAAATRIANIQAYASTVARTTVAPIDHFYAQVTSILQVATPTFLAQHASLGALFMVGFVSTTENYFRDIFARIVATCPIAQSRASDEKISLGTVVWHKGDLPERGAFEHLSFTSAKSIQNAARAFLDYSWKDTSPSGAALIEFEKICELRHGIVHSGGILGGKNALRLDLRRTAANASIVVNFAELQESAAVCSTLVSAANQELFSEMVQRWALAWRKQASWDAKRANRRFGELWRLFHSEADARLGLTAAPMTQQQCRKQVCREFKL